jgi:predicted metalloprotease
MSADEDRAEIARINRFAVYNRDCGHVLGIHPDRATFEPMIARMQASGRYSLRTRRSTPDDVDAVLLGVKCELCAGDRT